MLVSAPTYDCKLTTIMLHTDRQQVAMPLQELYDAAFAQLEDAVERDKSGQVEDAIERYEVRACGVVCVGGGLVILIGNPSTPRARSAPKKRVIDRTDHL